LKVGVWSADELDMLKELYDSGCDIIEMRDKLNRAAGSICGRLVKDYNIVRSDIKGYNEYIKTDAYAASVIANNDRLALEKEKKKLLKKECIVKEKVVDSMWSIEDDDILRINFDNKTAVLDVEKYFKDKDDRKSCGVIIGRLVKLGLINLRQEAPGYLEYTESDNYRNKIITANKLKEEKLKLNNVVVELSKVNVLKKIVDGIIYCIYSDKQVYIGKTSGSLSRRLRHHKTCYNSYLKLGNMHTKSALVYADCDGFPSSLCLLKIRCNEDDLCILEKRYIEWFDCVNKINSSPEILRVKLDPKSYVCPHEYLKDVNCCLDVKSLNCAKFGIDIDELEKRLAEGSIESL
jgi:hypothetical protein